MKILPSILLLQAILFGAKILGMIDWAWGWVTAPIWLPLILLFLFVVLLKLLIKLGDPIGAYDD